jgi:hypothetical protein
MRQKPEFAILRWRADQIFDIHFWASATVGIEITHSSLEPAFNSARATVSGVLQNRYDEPKQRRRHPAGDAESEADILACIPRNHEKSTLTTQAQIRHYCSTKFNKEMTKGWVDSFLRQHKTESIETPSTPQEDEELRLQVP